MAKEYIEREAAINAAILAHNLIDNNPCQNIRDCIGSIPAADVVTRDCYDRVLVENDELRKERPVVRCKYCKNFKDGWCYNPNTFDDDKTRGNTTPNWFCADGERKDGYKE